MSLIFTVALALSALAGAHPAFADGGDFSLTGLSVGDQAGLETQARTLLNVASGNSLMIEQDAASKLSSASGHMQPMLLYPLRYDAGSSYAPDERCALMMQTEGSNSYYAVSTIGSGEAAGRECRFMSGIGLVAHPTSDMPDIVLLYQTQISGEAGITPVLLVWDRAAGHYMIDPAATHYLGQLHGEPTLDSMIAAMLKYRRR